MSLEQQVNIKVIEETRKQINRLLEEVARYSEMDMPPAEYYGELLKRTLQGLAAPAGVVWMRTAQGHLQVQHQINLRQVGLEQDESNRQSHNELLRQAFQQGRPMHLPPHSSTGTTEGGGAAPGNPTDYDVLLVPIVIEQLTAGLIEIWISPNRNPNAVPGFLQFLTRLAGHASVYQRNTKLRQMVGQQQLWNQLEAFARQIHGTLNPTEVAYLVANESRRLIECDRVSVGTRIGRKTSIAAISGADVVEKRSNLVQLMRTLGESVLAWGEKLVYSGIKDDSLPPDILKALDNFLAESNSKLLVVLPLHDDRENEDKDKTVSTKKRPPRSVLIMESFEPPASTEQLIARVEVVGRHAGSALFNAIEHRRIPLRWLWQPIAKIQDGLGGKARAIGIAIGVGVAFFLAAMVLVPYPLKMDAKGQLLPEDRRWVYSPVSGQVTYFAEGVDTGKDVHENEPLIRMHDVELQLKVVQLQNDIRGAQGEIATLVQQEQAAVNPAERLHISAEKQKAEYLRSRKSTELNALKARTNADELRPGDFWLKAPLDGTILNWGFREALLGKYVKPSEPLLRIGDKDQKWTVELKVPQKHIGQVLYAYRNLDQDQELDVDILVMTAPTKTFKGKLSRQRIAAEASPNKEDATEPEPAVLAVVRIDGEDIPNAYRIPKELLLSGSEVHSKIRCGNRAMGYSLFYGIWEFFYEKVAFFF